MNLQKLFSTSDDVCQTIRISLRNDALISQGSLEGKYNLSSDSNNEKSWESHSKSIWFDSGKNVWLIGSQENKGTSVAGVYALSIPGSGPDNPKTSWNYRNKGWNKDSNKDIKVQCIDNAGIIFKILYSSYINHI